MCSADWAQAHMLPSLIDGLSPRHNPSVVLTVRRGAVGKGWLCDGDMLLLEAKLLRSPSVEFN